MHEVRGGRRYIAVIGIDRYQTWPALQNAAKDARGVLDVFERLGFERIGEPLVDGAATGDALRRLVTDDLAGLREDDSLVLFFAGHGHTRERTIADGARVQPGYLIPVDAEPPGGRTSTWLRLDAWLDDVDALAARHILVILDACHAGIALSPVIRWRGEGIRLPEPLEQLGGRRSRRVFTSALEGQLAMDSGPVPGHSLFTGCLVEALRGGYLHRTGERRAIGSDIWNHVRRRVVEFPCSRQTPDLGTLELHDHGDLIVDLWPAPIGPTHQLEVTGSGPTLGPEPRGPGGTQRAVKGSRLEARGARTKWSPVPAPPVLSAGIRSVSATAGSKRKLLARAGRPRGRSTASPRAAAAAGASQQEAPVAGPQGGSVSRVDGTPLDAAFVAALERQDAERRRGGAALSVVAGDSMAALPDWAAWAAGRGYLTLVTEGAGVDAAIDELLAQTPWLRCVAMARRSLAAAAQLDVEAIDAALDARSDAERRAWIDDIAGLDARVRVSGWLLSAVRGPAARVPDVATAPVQGGELLSVLGALATPMAVLVQHAAPSTAWLERALPTAAALVAYLPGRPVAVGAPRELVTRVLGGGRPSAARTMARQGLVEVAGRPRPAVSGARAGARAREQAVQELHAALERDPRTARRFERGVRVATRDGGSPVEVELAARTARLAVAIDGWYHDADPQGYRRDRGDDARLAQAGYFVLRFTAEDVGSRLALVVHEIALGVGGRRASGGAPW